MQLCLRTAKSLSILVLASVLLLPPAFAATASISTNQQQYYLNSGETLSLSGGIEAGSDADAAVDVYVQVQINSGIFVYYLDSTFQWRAYRVPILEGFKLASISAPNFYSIGVAGLPAGTYQFSIIVVPAGANPGNNADRLAYGVATIVVNPRPSPGTNLIFYPPTVLNGVVGTAFRYDFSPFAAGGGSPYHFQKDSGGGFPPLGLVLGADGVLSGVPSIAGQTTTSVCAVDLVGNQKCADITITISPKCTYTYTSWTACQSNNTQTRTVTSSTPTGCVGTPVLSQACTYTPSCTYTYSNWSACQPNNTQTRTVISSTPAGCAGTPLLSQACTYGADGAVTWNVSDRCNNGAQINYKFYDFAKNWMWPSASSYYYINYGQTLTSKLTCTPGNKICLGASSGSLYWGVGLAGNYSCTNCCHACDGATHSYAFGCSTPSPPSGAGQCSGFNDEPTACGPCNSDADCGSNHCYTSVKPAPFCQ